MTQMVLQEAVRQIVGSLDAEPDREALRLTPKRVADSLRFLTSGYGITPLDVIEDGIFEAPSNGLVWQRDVEFYSLCEHHLLPFYGKMSVAYVPDKKIIGLSKIGRLIDVFARRLQVQERLTEQVADALMQVLEPKGVAVWADALHFCMMMRGVGKQHGSTVTFVGKGELAGQAGRQLFT